MIDRFSPVHALLAAAALGLLALWLTFQPSGVQLSRWAGMHGAAAAFVGTAAPRAGASGLAQLDAYNAGSQLHDEAAGGRVRYYRRPLDGGEVAYMVVQLDGRAEVALVNADGAIPSSDQSGDTTWADGQKHLATVAQMAQAPYATREGKELLGAINVSFHGPHTSSEGSIVIDGKVLRVNSGRAALCITPGGRARIGLFDAAALRGCQQAVGAGPVTLLGGKVVSPDVSTETADLLPFNPLGEDFVQIDWRRKVYNGSYPKTLIGVGGRPDGRSFVVLMVTTGIGGVDAARQLQAMGCSDGLGADDDTSTQAVWRGASLLGGSPAPVPDALAIYALR